MNRGALRILHVTEAFGGGVFTSLTKLSNGLAARGHEVHLVFSRRTETPFDVETHLASAVHLHEIELARAINPIADLRGLLALRRLMKAIDPDIVHLHSSKAGVLGRIVARSMRRERTTFYSPRGLSFLQEDHSPRARKVYQAIEWAAARLGGTIVACSASERRLIEQRIKPRAVALVENAVDVESILPRHSRDDGTINIGIVGRITYARNADLFAEVSRRLSGSDVQFRWIGGGDEQARTALIGAGVIVTDWMPRAEALAAMRWLDIYLHPSRWEGMPVALIEAQVCGLPAVATDVVGNRDVVTHGETGYLCRSPEQIVARLGELLRNPDLRIRMGARARELAVQRFNLDRLVSEMIAVYARALDSAAQARA
jgi:glycosyltransferase involved in cell wall biosynthesis